MSLSRSVCLLYLVPLVPATCSLPFVQSHPFLSNEAEMKPLLRDSLLSARHLCDAQLRELQRADWYDFVAKNMVRYAEGDYRTFWDFLGIVTHRKHRSLSITPMFDSRQDTLVCDSHDIADVWVHHYSALLRDVTGHSRDPSFWTDTADPVAPEMTGINGPITESELKTALGSLSNWKAPGDDQLTREPDKHFPKKGYLWRRVFWSK